MTQLSTIIPFMTDERIQQQIKITQKADGAIEAARVELGMTKVEMLSRLCQWFAEQPSMVRKLVLGLVDDELKPAASRVLAQRLVAVNPSRAAEKAAEDSHFDEVTEEIRTGKAGKRKGA